MKVNEVTIDEMAKATGGLEYEAKVLDAVKKTIPKFQKYMTITDLDIGTAGFSNVGVDLEVNIYGKPFHVEIKKDTAAQMGGTSVGINLKTGEMVLAKPDAADADLKELFFAAAQLKMKDFKNIVKYFRQNSPPELVSKIKDYIPFGAVTKEVWEQAQKEGLLKKLSADIPVKDVNWVANHYNRKGVYYIQIGGAGLFYLNSNPLKLPIPKFETPINIELRLGRGGSSLRKVKGVAYYMMGCTYRVQGRLQEKKIKSPLTLDDPDDVAKIFQMVIDQSLKDSSPKAASKSKEKQKVDTKPVSKPAPVAEPAVDTKIVKAKSKIDPKQKAKAALATGGKSK
jgi:hypothetical protein